MYHTVEYKELEELKDTSYQLIDVRSEYEFNKETIPGAINIPVLLNEERIDVGSTYKNKSAEEARKVGIKYISKRLPDIYQQISDLIFKYDKLVFFCARGGYRSSSIVSLINSIGHKVYRLQGGYKDYRKHINNELPKIVEQVNFITLYGNTGVGKTDILLNLEKEGMDILDLEGHANHRGSILGGVGLGEQNSQKMFESLLYNSLRDRKSDIIFTEGESIKIGQLFIPKYLFDAIQDSTHILIKADMDRRVNNILKEYISDSSEDDLIDSMNYLRRQIGHKKIDQYIEMIKSGDEHIVARILMEEYYDPMYEYGDSNYEKIFFNNGLYDISNNIIEWANSKKDTEY